MMISRRELLVGGALTAAHRLTGFSQENESSQAKVFVHPKGTLIESHVHMVSDDPARFPFADNAPRGGRPETVESFSSFAQEAGINHAVIVTPEPYQADPSYMEYCLAHEPSEGFFKAICLLDPVDPQTPKRLKSLAEKHPRKLVGMRIHELHELGTPSTTTGMLRDRDLKDPQMEMTWRAVHELGLTVLIQSTPHFAPAIYDLAAKFRDMPVVLDHLDRPGQGTPEEFNGVLKLATLPSIYIKFTTTGVTSASKEPWPHLDAKPLIKRVYEAFGPDRTMWGELGLSIDQFEKAVQLFDTMLDFAPESHRSKIRGGTAKKLYAFS
jgi:predicted TIM-barrel fold metal-dependent hydrolase